MRFLAAAPRELSEQEVGKGRSYGRLFLAVNGSLMSAEINGNYSKRGVSLRVAIRKPVSPKWFFSVWRLCLMGWIWLTMPAYLLQYFFSMQECLYQRVFLMLLITVWISFWSVLKALYSSEVTSAWAKVWHFSVLQIIPHNPETERYLDACRWKLSQKTLNSLTPTDSQMHSGIPIDQEGHIL